MKNHSLLILLFIASACCQAASQPVVLVADPKVLSIQIHDNHEPLVNLKKEGGIAIGPSPEIPNNQDYFYLRKTVYEKLLSAQKLLPPGLKFCLYEGYRSLQLQKKLFDARFAKIKKLHPEWSYQQQFLETTRLVSPLITLTGAKNRPPHSTGGAFDIYLINNQGEAVDMGIHPKDWMLDTYGKVSISDSKCISKQAQRYRKIMSHALSAVGFQNIDTEYWHWSYGDAYWAFKKHQACAIYNTVPHRPKNVTTTVVLAGRNSPQSSQSR